MSFPSNSSVFLSCVGARFGSLDLKIGSLESEKIIKGNIYEIQSEIFRVPTCPYRVPNIFLKKTELSISRRNLAFYENGS